MLGFPFSFRSFLIPVIAGGGFGFLIGIRHYKLTKSNDQLAKEINDCKLTEETLRESEERFRTIYENAPMSIDSFDKDGRCILWNKACEKLFGWTMEELNACDNPLSLFYPDPHIQKQVIDSVLLNPDGVFRERRPMTKDGSELLMLWADFRLPDETVISMGYDITENRKAEEALRESEAQKKAILDAAIDTIRLVDKDMRVIWANKANTKELKKGLQELVGNTCYNTLLGRDAPCPGCPTKKALASGEIEHTVIEQTDIKGFKGTSFWKIMRCRLRTNPVIL